MEPKKEKPDPYFLQILERAITTPQTPAEKQAVIDDFYRALNFIQSQGNEKMAAAAMVQFVCYYLMMYQDSLTDTWFKDKHSVFQKLLTDKQEYVSIHEIFPQKKKEETNISFQVKYHYIHDVIGKRNGDADQALHSYIRSHIKPDMSPEQLEKGIQQVRIQHVVNQAWAVCKDSIDTLNKRQTLYQHYKHISYPWYSFLNNTFYTKSSIVNIIEVKGRYFFVACGFFNKDYQPPKPSYIKYYMYTFLIGLLAYIAYALRINDFNRNGLVIYTLILLLVYYLFIRGVRDPYSYEVETEERNSITQISLSVGGTVCALIIASGGTIIFPSLHHKLMYQRNLLVSFMILILTILIQPYDNTGKAIYYTAIVQKLIILYVFLTIVTTILAVVFNK